MSTGIRDLDTENRGVEQFVGSLNCEVEAEGVSSRPESLIDGDVHSAKSWADRLSEGETNDGGEIMDTLRNRDEVAPPPVNVGARQGKRTYRSLFPANRNPKNGMRLEFKEPVMVDGTPTAVIDKEDVRDEINYWETALVGYVVGDTPSFSTIRRYVDEVWKHISNPKFTCTKIVGSSSDLMLKKIEIVY